MSNFYNIRDRIDALEREGAPTVELRRWLAEREKASEVRAIMPSDLAWPLIPTCSLEEHLNGGFPLSAKVAGILDAKQGVSVVRPTLSCAIEAGRIYALSAAQRAVIKELFNMIAGMEVEVKMLATFPGMPTIVREVVLRIDPLNSARKVTIERWGDFCSMVKSREVDAEQQRQVDVLAGRISKLIKDAKNNKPKEVKHNLTTTGLAFEWHAVIQQREVAEHRKLDAGEVRDILRDLLLARGEHGLVVLVKEPSFAATSAAVREMDEQLGAEMDRVMKEMSTKK